MSDLEAITAVLEQSLAPQTAKQAEQQLRSQETQQGFPLTLLHVIASQNLPVSTRLAAALFFKNFIKRRWVDEDGNYLNADVAQIKTEIIPMMITLPNNLQVQIGEAISIIADSDFPDRWPTLIDDLVSKLSEEDMLTNKGVLTVAHSIFKRWRPLFRSDALFLEIKLVLEKFQVPFLQLLQRVDTLIDENQGNKPMLDILFDVLLLLVKIYHDLNCQDIPEFFEDNMSAGMGVMHKYLIYTNPLLVDEDEETEIDILSKVKTSICELIQLYTTRYEDVFEPMIPQFIQSVWNLLTSIGLQSKYDILVSKLLNFLTCIARLPKHAQIFNNETALKEITEKIIIPNLTVREADEELFEDDPIEYIRRDLEGSDSDTRRRASIDFLRELKSKNEAAVTQVVLTYITQYLQEYNNNPSQWKYKDLAIYLFTALASKNSSSSSTSTPSYNILLDVVQFFANNIVSDLMTGNIHPILKVDAIKYIYTFRSQLTKQQLSESFPILNTHLQAENYVQYTYASITIERILSLRGEDKKLMFNKVDLQGIVQSLLGNLFQLILKYSSTPEKLAENEFLMKTLMRVMIIAEDTISTIALELVKNLLSIVAIIAKNPSNPRFSHYTFESIATLIKYNNTESNWEGFMSTIVPAGLEILGADVQEFVPYVFQILSYLLEVAPESKPLPETYKQLIQPLLSPSVWEFKGNIPAVTRLLQAIINKDCSGFTDVTALLGVFQKLIASKLNEYYGFDLLESILLKFPDAAVAAYSKNIAVLLLQRLQNSRTEKYVKRLVSFVSKLTIIKNSDYAIDFFDQVQPGIFGTIFEQFFVSSIPNIGNLNEKKIVVVGLSNLISQSNKVLTGDYQKLLVPTLEILIQFTTSESIKNVTADTDELMELEMEEVSSFGSNYSRLAIISAKTFDPTNMNLQQGKLYFVEQLKKMDQQTGGAFINQLKSQLSQESLGNLAQLGF